MTPKREPRRPAKKSSPAPKAKKSPAKKAPAKRAPTNEARPREGGKIVEFKMTGRYADLLTGKLPVEDLDFEELARLQLRDKNGHFTGRPMRMLPAGIVKRMRREFFARGDEMFATAYEKAIATMVTLMTSPMTEDATRLRAAQYVIERVRGKIPDVVVVDVEEKAWQSAMAKIFVKPEELPAGSSVSDAGREDIVDADIVEG